MQSIANIPNEYNCHRNLYKIVWGILCCSKCGSKRLLLRRNYEYCPDCKHKSSVKSETIFRYSKLSFGTIWILISCWQNQLNIGEIHLLTRVSYFTIRKWIKCFRRALRKRKTDKLHDVVEINESFFGKRRYGYQRCIVGAIERFKTNGKRRIIRLAIIPNRERDTLESFIEDNVLKGSHIATDCLWSYNELELLGYMHEFCNHSKYHFGPTNLIEGLWIIRRKSKD